MASSTTQSAKYMRDIIRQNPENFRFMCPDETESNKFMALFEATDRAYMWPVKSYDENLAPDGRVMEILSEHNIQGWLQGYLLTGRHGIFVTYEAFAMIVASMVDQYAKFLKQMAKIPWRKKISSLNYLLTSLGWRQEHNGYSHQNPSFVSNILEKHGKFCSVYFPADANSLMVILEDCFKRKNGINVIVAGKQLMPQWLTLEEAREELKKGIGTWKWINPDHAKNPDVVFAATGDALVQESLAAIQFLEKHLPELKIRFVNVSELTALGVGDEKHPVSLSDKDFEHYFTKDKPIIYNFHGYPGVIKRLIFGHPHADRFSVHGYIEEGTTTTPFEMMVFNKTSRYHLVIDAIEKAGKQKAAIAKKGRKVIRMCEKALRDHERFIRKYGKDNDEVAKWKYEIKNK
jgi:xylulose-5-phosphate/fructose-6-phosphate phosphoketolase